MSAALFTDVGKITAMTKDEILIAAMALDRDERDELAQALWQSMAPAEFSAEQLSEVRRRIARIDNGDSPTLAGEEVMAELRKRYRNDSGN